MVRLDPTGIDVRSISRYDMPDLGDNCRRVTDIVNKIKALPSDPTAQDQAADGSATAPVPGSVAAPGKDAPADGGGD